MYSRRNFVHLAVGAIALTACAPIPSVTNETTMVGGENFDSNHFTARGNVFSSVGYQRVITRPGQFWEDFSSIDASVIRHFNRQNVQPFPGQMILVPDGRVSMNDINPFSRQMELGSGYYVMIDHDKYAWALYWNNTFVRWGAAVCGSDNLTPLGPYEVTETAGKDRVSNRWPIINAAERGGALMPYYMRLTSRGVGMHARYLSGSHETKGCIGMFYDDAKQLNLEIARRHDLRVRIQ